MNFRVNWRQERIKLYPFLLACMNFFTTRIFCFCTSPNGPSLMVTGDKFIDYLLCAMMIN